MWTHQSCMAPELGHSLKFIKESNYDVTSAHGRHKTNEREINRINISSNKFCREGFYAYDMSFVDGH